MLLHNGKKEEVKVALYPMHYMLGYFLTKPIQAKIFAWMREKILNLPS